MEKQGELEVRIEKQTVRYLGRQTKLPDFSFRLLCLLGERAPSAVTFEEIERVVWRAQVTRETIKQRVKMLRDSLATVGAPEDAIEAARNVGYRLTLALRRYEGPPTSNSSTWIRLITAAGLIVAVAAALIFGFAGSENDTSAKPLRLSVQSRPLGSAAMIDPAAWEGARRTLVRDLSKLRNAVVVSSPDTPLGSDLVVDMAVVRSAGDERLALQLVQARTGAVLWAETYPAGRQGNERALMHFVSNIHAQVEALGMELERDGFPHQPRGVQALYLDAVALARSGEEDALLAAKNRLNAALKQRPDFVLARSLRARVDAALVTAHGHDPALGARALAEAQSLVTEHPQVPEFRRALAEAQVATGKLADALRNLESAERELPFLRRDIRALEQRIRAAGGAEKAPSDPT